MDFEEVSIDEARDVLEALPPDIASVLASVPGYWQNNRRPPLASDRALTGRAMDWLGRLPENVRPQATTLRYARIINLIAEAWPSPAQRSDVFDHLLNDRRVGRRGFPVDIEREIAALCLYASSLP
jgi:hypothetical protein